MSDLGVGDWEIPYLDVAPYDVGTTTAALRLHSPADENANGTTIALDAGVETTVDGTQVLRFAALAAVQYTVAGWWVQAWTVTGVGAGDEDRRFFVAPTPLAGGPTWTPTRSRVASRVPSRSLVPDATGANVDLMTFGPTTRPTGTQVDQLIADAVAWVLLPIGELDESLYDAASACAAVYAAASVERGYPEREVSMAAQAIDRAGALFAQADALRADLVAANTAASGGDDPGVFEIVPTFEFPAKPPWADLNL